MGCSNCNKSGPAGCKNNGFCRSGGCNKLNVFDWLSNMDMPSANRFDIVEIRFKNGRKGYFRNNKDLDLMTGGPVVVGMVNGHHIGHVSLQGELVRLQMAKKNVIDNDDIRAIHRMATRRDMEHWDAVRKKESSLLYRTREIVREEGIKMKMTDVEFQADGTKATFFYSSDERVDFRKLIKIMAREFKIRIEMRQISLREEAGRIGGIGVCGRELCCSTWLTNFKAVSSQAARYQYLSINPTKLSGQCGRLKCCLNYELDTYMEAMDDIPEVNEPLLTAQGNAKLQKTDIFKRVMWFSYDNDDNWHSLKVKRVIEIQEMNKEGIKPVTLHSNEEESPVTSSIINSDLVSMDRKFRDKAKQKRRQNKKRRKKRPFKPSSNKVNE